MVTQTAEYALRAVTWLAEDEHTAPGTGSPHTVHQIAEATSMPAEYLSKVLQELSKAGIVTSQRGPLGGFRLARRPSTITIFDVVQAVSPMPRVHECPLGRPDHQSRLCALHQLLNDAVASVEEVFRNVTIADLLANPDRTVMRCAGVCNASLPPDDQSPSPTPRTD